MSDEYFLSVLSFIWLNFSEWAAALTVSPFSVEFSLKQCSHDRKVKKLGGHALVHGMALKEDSHKVQCFLFSFDDIITI